MKTSMRVRSEISVLVTLSNTGRLAKNSTIGVLSRCMYIIEIREKYKASDSSQGRQSCPYCVMCIGI